MRGKTLSISASFFNIKASLLWNLKFQQCFKISETTKIKLSYPLYNYVAVLCFLEFNLRLITVKQIKIKSVQAVFRWKIHTHCTCIFLFSLIFSCKCMWVCLQRTKTKSDEGNITSGLGPANSGGGFCNKTVRRWFYSILNFRY